MAYKTEAEKLFYSVQKRKLSDIFANGFSVPDGMKQLVDQSELLKYDYNIDKEKVYDSGFASLFNLVLQSLAQENSSVDYHGNFDYRDASSTLWYVVFNSQSLPIGFTKTQSKDEEQNNINDTRSFIIKNSNDFVLAKPVIDRYICTIFLMFNKGMSSNKTVLKSDLTQYQSNDVTVVQSMKEALKRKKQDIGARRMGEVNASPEASLIKELNVPINEQMKAIADSSVTSVLNLPIGYDLSFPNGDISQIQLLYKSMQEELGAVLQMPLTKLFGTPPVGFQATGEYDRLSYEQTLESIANRYCVPVLKEVASMAGYSKEEIDSIKYLSTYQIEILMKLVNITSGNSSLQVQELTENYIEIKTGIKKKESEKESNKESNIENSKEDIEEDIDKDNE